MSQHATHIWMIASLSLREARRRRLLWIAGGLGVAFLALFGLGFWAAYQEVVSEAGRSDGLLVSGVVTFFVLAGLYAVNFLIVMTTVLTAVGSVSQEIASNTIHAIAAKPLRRWEIFLGKWLGHALMLIGYAVFLTSGIFLITFALAGFVPPNPFEALALLILEGLVILSLVLLGSTMVSTLANGVMVFMLYGVAFIGAWTEQIGSLLQSQVAVDVGVISSLLLPSEALWRRAAHGLQTSVTRGFNATGPFGTASVPSDWFVVYAGIYMLLMIALGLRVFARRDF